MGSGPPGQRAVGEHDYASQGQQYVYNPGSGGAFQQLQKVSEDEQHQGQPANVGNAAAA